MVDEVSIRLYQPKDRARLHKIAADTAFFGDPIEVYMEDRRAFNDSFYAYYTDLEPEHCWVACNQNDEVVGFLTGCTNTTRHDEWYEKTAIPQLRQRVLKGYYRIGPRSLRYAFELWLSERRKEGPEVDLTPYPAHLHINVDQAYRGYGLGKKLIQTYLNQLKQLNIPGVHLFTTSQNEKACLLYERMGFNLLGAKSSRMWLWKLGKEIDNRCYAQKLIA